MFIVVVEQVTKVSIIHSSIVIAMAAAVEMKIAMVQMRVLRFVCVPIVLVSSTHSKQNSIS